MTATARGFVVELARASEHRRRFSLAHEIGHTLFYKDSGIGPRHLAGVLSGFELKAEEYLCNLFARSLLIPRDALLRIVRLSSHTSLGDLLDVVEQCRVRFNVSRPVAMLRLADVFDDIGTMLLVQFRYCPNSRTNQDPDLRVVCSSVIGQSASRFRVWLNRTPSGMGLHTVDKLYEGWLGLGETSRGGAFELKDGKVQRSEGAAVVAQECIELTEVTSGKWAKRQRRAEATARLISPPNTPRREVTVIAALKLLS